MRADRRFIAWTAAVLLAGAPRAWALEPAHLVAGFDRTQAMLETSGPRCLLLEVYLALTPEQRLQGLMHVEQMAEFEGMYFGYGIQQVEITLWMKNTIIPLDMLFIDRDGKVAGIARDTKPFSTERISSGVPVAGVLEVNAGFARRWRVARGTRLVLF
jgi:uncharacterized protein